MEASLSADRLPVPPAQVSRYEDVSPSTIPMALPIQPNPVDMLVTYYEATNETVTTIMREWAPGDSGPSGRCTRCSLCVARRNKCLMSIGAEIPRSEAKDYSTRSLGIVFVAR